MSSSNRRKFLLRSLGALGTTLLGAWIFRRPILKNLIFTGDFDTNQLTTAPSGADNLCVLTARQVDGPYFYPAPQRSNVVEDRHGQKLELELQVIRHPDCTPVAGAVVEIWHCDAEGVYSGYPAEVSHDVWKTAMLVIQNGEEVNGEMHVDPVNDNRYLRGQQRTDENGAVTFNTIVPGWYVGRVPHIHAKVMVGETEEFSTQLYFEKDLCDRIYTTQEPYKQYGKCPNTFEKDIVLSQAGSGEGLLLNVDERNAQHFRASALIGLKTVQLLS